MTSATKPRSNAKLEFEAIGITWIIDLEIDPAKANDLSRVIANRIKEFDLTYSRFRHDSWLANANQAGSHKLPNDFHPLFSFYKQLFKQTNGKVTPLIGDAMERAGYDAKYSLKPKPLKQIPSFDDVIKLKGDTLHVKYQVSLDFGAAGKGYLIDLIAEILEKQNVQGFLIDAGGDMHHHYPSPTPVGLENPNNFKQALGIVNLQSASLCGSAGNRRKWAEYNHIINPDSLKSVTDTAAVWVLVDHSTKWPTMIADGLATALFFVQPEALSNFNFEYLVVKADNSYEVSSKFLGKLFYENY